MSDISSDAFEVSKLACDHLLAQQYTRFAYVGNDDRGWSTRRERAFYQILADKGFHPHIYRQPKQLQDRTWEREQRYLVQWISELPMPIGLFACDDDRGRQVLETCTLAGIRVPTDVAVLGVDNDEVFCDLADPPLSSISLNAESAGYRAAELLDGLMSRRIRKPRRILVEALRVVTRRSTESGPIGDEYVGKALRFIRHMNGCDISVLRVAKEVSTSRRSLEKRLAATESWSS